MSSTGRTPSLPVLLYASVPLHRTKNPRPVVPVGDLFMRLYNYALNTYLKKL